MRKPAPASVPASAAWSRRGFLRSIGLGGAAGAVAAAPAVAGADQSSSPSKPVVRANGRAKNVLMFVSDGMNIGTLSLTNLFSREFKGTTDPWLRLYQEHPELVARGLMDVSSADSPVTDSAAIASCWSSGHRIPNGRINIDADGNRLTPLYETLGAKGKATALVTTARVTHATPAGFASAVDNRGKENDIAPQYRELGVDVILGGGRPYFQADRRPDELDLMARYRADGYHVATNRQQMLEGKSAERMLGLFHDDHLPYHIDWLHCGELQQTVPTLAEMTSTAIDLLADRPEGFVMQIEAARVDHAGHLNDLGAIIHDQIAFGEALEVGLRFAMERDDTLVIITTDHGCGGPNLNGAGPGYRDSGTRFSQINKASRSFEALAARLARQDGEAGDDAADLVASSLGIDLSSGQRRDLLAGINAIKADGRLSAPRLVTPLADLQSGACAVSWNSTAHTGDLVEIAALGAGSDALRPFIENRYIRPWILSATGAA